MTCSVLGQIAMFDQENDIVIVDDIVHKGDEIYTNHKDFMFNDVPPWIPKDAWGRRLKDGNYVFHSYKSGTKPKHPRNSSASLVDRKRRFFCKLMMDSGNPTWKDVRDFKNWVVSYDQANTVEAVKEIICGKYCFICKKRNSKKTSDIGGDTMILNVNGFKGDKRK